MPRGPRYALPPLDTPVQAPLRRVLDAMNEYAGSIRNGYVTIQDLQTTLREEAGIELTFNSLGGGDK